MYCQYIIWTWHLRRSYFCKEILSNKRAVGPLVWLMSHCKRELLGPGIDGTFQLPGAKLVTNVRLQCQTSRMLCADWLSWTFPNAHCYIALQISVCVRLLWQQRHIWPSFHLHGGYFDLIWCISSLRIIVRIIMFAQRMTVLITLIF